MEQMKKNIVKEWEEDQRKKAEAAAKAGGHGEVTNTVGEDTKAKRAINVEEQSIAESKLTVEGDNKPEIKQKKSWKDGLKNLIGK